MSDAAETSAEDADDSSSNFTSIVDVEEQPVVDPLDTPLLLREFRQQWKQELTSDGAKAERPSSSTDNGNQTSSPDKSLDDEQRATILFNQGSELEELGKVFEAMHLYRRAIQIVPDIEQKIYQKSKNKQLEGERKSKTEEDDLNANADAVHDDVNEYPDVDETDLENVDLMVRFHAAVRRSGCLLHKAESHEHVISTGSTKHISQLPMEIILYILRWVVSSDLDVRSLDQCSLVSKGFYMCARDTEIWRLTCLRIWGVQLGALADGPYLSWRQMYMERPRINFSGCYISKASYWRFGENSFQDRNYRPIHLVQYYRYVRFFSNGEVLMLTTPDDPGQTVNKLKEMSHSGRNEMLKGHFRLHGDLVILAMKRNRALRQQSGRSARTAENGPDRQPTFCVELVIHTSGRRRCNQLRWKNYSIVNTQNLSEEVTTNFELGSDMYPTLIFSRCKGYHAWSDKPL